MFVNSADSIAAYDRFIQRVRKTESIWLIVDSERDLPATCHSHDKADSFVVPVWSDRAYATRVQPKFAIKSEVVSIPLKAFMRKTLPFLIDRGELTGPNWNSALAGLEIEPTELLRKLKSNDKQ